MSFENYLKEWRGNLHARENLREIEQSIDQDLQYAVSLSEAIVENTRQYGYDGTLSYLYNGIFSHLVNKPTPEVTAMMIRMGATAPIKDGETRDFGIRDVAARRPVEEIAHALTTDSLLLTEHQSYGLALVHEIATRGDDLTEHMSHYLQWGTAVEHPACRLPLTLFGIESALPNCMKPYPGGHIGYSRDFSEGDGTTGPMLQDVLPGIGASIPLDKANALAPFERWGGGISGEQVRAMAYRSDGTTYPARTPEPIPRPSQLCFESSGKYAACGLFNSSMLGGAYSSRTIAWPARLKLWQALAEITGKGSQASLEEISDAAQQARWFNVSTDDPWFNNIAWDLWWIFDDGQRIVTIAATDSCC